MERIKWIDEVIERAREEASLEGKDNALNWLRPLLYDEPGYGRLHLALAEIYHRYSDELPLAEQHYRMAIRFDGTLTAAYLALAEILAEDERHDDVLRICKSGLSACRTNKGPLLEAIGKAWELKQKYRKAIRHYRKALRHAAQFYQGKILEESIRRCNQKRK